MVDKLSRGSNSSSFKTVSIDIGVIGVQGNATETRKNCNIDQKERKKKQKHFIKSHLRKKSSTLIRLKCIWHLLAS